MNWFCRLVTFSVTASVVSGLAVPNAHAVTIDWVTVGDPGNTADTNGYGAVADVFQIGKYEVTIQQYADFLNAKAQSDPYSLWKQDMNGNLNIAGISRAGTSGTYTYSVKAPTGSTPTGANSPGNRPIAQMDWFSAARFANWMQNGQGSGDTETGAYTLNGATSGTFPARNPGAQIFIPTEDQWYKAAFYKGGGTNAGYWDYATQSDTAPSNVLGSGANRANYALSSIYTVTQSGYTQNQNYLTNIGAFNTNPSAYGTFDQSGNITELTDGTAAAGATRYLRGGSWNSTTSSTLSVTYREAYNNPATHSAGIGFRLATVPEPSTCVLALAGIACGGYSLSRRRRKPV
jgi:sulfatase modifying factor 1